MSKKRKYSKDYVVFGCTFVIDSDGSERQKCFLCGKVLANASLKPAKLKEHLTPIHPKNALDSVNSFHSKKARFEKYGTLPKFEFTKTKSLASKRHIRCLPHCQRKEGTYDRRDIDETMCLGND